MAASALTTALKSEGLEANKARPPRHSNAMALPAYHNLIRVGYRDFKGHSFMITLPVLDDTTDTDITNKIRQRWKAHWLKRMLMWLFLLQEQVLVFAMVELNAVIDLEAQLGQVLISIKKIVKDAVLQPATAERSPPSSRRTLVANLQLLASGRAFDPNIEPLAIMLVWERTMTPAILLCFTLAAIATAVGIIAGFVTNSVSNGATIAGSAAAILTMIEMCLLAVYRPPS